MQLLHPGSHSPEHREARRTEHLSKYGECPNAAPESVRQEALLQLATKPGVSLLLTPGNDRGEDDIEMEGFEGVTAGGLEAELDRLQLIRFSREAQQQARPLPGKTVPPTARLHEVHNLKEIDTIRKGWHHNPPGTRTKNSRSG